MIKLIDGVRFWPTAVIGGFPGPTTRFDPKRSLVAGDQDVSKYPHLGRAITLQKRDRLGAFRAEASRRSRRYQPVLARYGGRTPVGRQHTSGAKASR